MRRLSLMLLLLAAALTSYAQSVTSSFYISVLDPAFLPTVTGSSRPYTIHFSDPQLDSWVQQYGITDFRRAYAASRLRALKQVYIVTCADPALMDALQSNYPNGFAGGYEATPVSPMVTTPNDYGKNIWTIKPSYVSSTIAGSQTYLELIRARWAWDYTKGDSNLRVGMVDRMVNRNHPDLKGKVLTTTPYPNNPKFPADTVEDKHGTLVAGFLGTKTNNDTGLAGMAWKCPIVNSSDMGDSANLFMSHDGIRIINNSWADFSNNCALIYKDTAKPAVQLLYDEVYENGTFVVCAAGNGPNPLSGYLCSDSTFRYPASYDHNFSVTSVGHFYDTATSGPNSGYGAPYNTRDVHQSSPYQGNAHQGNSRVDLCAPGYGMTGLYYSQGSPNDTFQQYTSEEGTSLAAPLVTGTAALMLSRQSCLTPYQLEYLLKVTAANISNITANKPYAGKLGAGRLHAENAVIASGPNSFSCNGSTATTMVISEIKASTLCFTGTTSQPQLSATIQNGTPPYSYRWMELADNRAILDDIYSATPQVTYLKANPYTRVVSFLLTVTDNSPIKKVASKHFYTVLKTGGGYDLGIRDSPFDLLNDTNTQVMIDARDINIWDGPDIWNRQQLDASINYTHQNPEFHKDSVMIGGVLQPNPLYNYVNVRIKNVGCGSSPATGLRLRAYWTKASLGESWPGDWKSNNITVYGNSLPAGREIDSTTVYTIPAIAPGGEAVVRMKWRGVNPKIYDSTSPSFHSCILARIEETPFYPFGMFTPELLNTVVTPNVMRNNNIATRNMDSYDLNPNNITAPGGPQSPVLVANADKFTQVFSITVSNDKADHPHLHGDLSEYVTGTLYLGSVWDLWVAGGMQGSGFVRADRETRSISYDPSTVLRLDNLVLPPNKKFEVNVQFTQRKGVQVFTPISDHIHVRMLLPGAGQDGEDYVYGSVGYELNIDQNATPPRKQIPTADLLQGTSDDSYIVYPNPAHQYVVVQRQQPGDAVAAVRLLDVTGRTVGTVQLPIGQNSVTLPLEGMSAGLYFVEVQGASSNHRYKVVIK